MAATALSQVIRRSEVIRTIRTGEPFTLEFVTADERRGTGGQLIKVVDWQKITADPAKEGSPGQLQTPSSALPKDPQHHVHKTFNIYNPKNSREHPIKVHYRLIVTFENKRVING